MLKEREEFLAKARREAEDIIDAGRQQAQRMVEKTEVVREANLHSRRIVDDAEKTSRDLKHEAEDYIDQKLASFEVVLERTMAAVAKGRDRLQVVIPADEVDDADDVRRSQLLRPGPRPSRIRIPVSLVAARSQVCGARTATDWQ